MNESTFCFGEFRLIPAHRELWRSNQPVRIQPRTLETVIYLVQHRDRVVGRDELISAVWGRVDVADNLLSQTIARARHALGDTAEEQHTIRTIARFGYRWILDVEVPADEPAPVSEAASFPEFDAVRPEPPPHLPSPPPLPPANRWKRHRLSAAALALLGIVGFASWPITPATLPPAQVQQPDDDVAAWPQARRLSALRDAVSSSHFDRAHAILRALPDLDRLQPEVRHEAAELALKEGRFEEALRAFKSLLFDLGEHGPPALVGAAFYGVGQAEFRRGLLDAAEPYFKLAIQVLPKAGAAGRVKLGMAWTSLGRLYSMRKTFEPADHAYAQARMALEGTGDLAALSQLENNAGVTLIARYRYAEALPRFQRAADLAAMTQDANTEARARMNLVNAQLVMLQPAAALQSEPRLRALRDLVGDPVLAANADLIRAKALTASGHLREAALALQAQAARPTPNDETLAAIRDIVSADLAFAQGAVDIGAHSVHALLASPYDSSEDDGVTAYALWQWLQSSKAKGATQDMAAAAAAAEAKSRVHPAEPTLALYASLARAETADTKGDAATAQSEFEHALQLVEATHVPFDVLRVVAGYTQFLLRHHLDAEASVIAERVAGWAEGDYTASLVQLSVYHAIGSEAWQSALARTRSLAGERKIPAVLTLAPPPSAAGGPRGLLAVDLL